MRPARPSSTASASKSTAQIDEKESTRKVGCLPATGAVGDVGGKLVQRTVGDFCGRCAVSVRVP